MLRTFTFSFLKLTLLLSAAYETRSDGNLTDDWLSPLNNVYESGAFHIDGFKVLGMKY